MQTKAFPRHRRLPRKRLYPVSLTCFAGVFLLVVIFGRGGESSAGAMSETMVPRVHAFFCFESTIQREIASTDRPACSPLRILACQVGAQYNAHTLFVALLLLVDIQCLYSLNQAGPLAPTSGKLLISWHWRCLVGCN